MRTNKIASRIKRNPKYPRVTGEQVQHTPDLVRRNFRPEKPNEIWASDVTYIWTREGWVYLAVTIDLYSRGVIGWQMKDKFDANLVLSSLNMAIMSRERTPKVHHSDQGREFSSKEFKQGLATAGILQSMSRRANCWDNAAVESFFHSLKSEFKGSFNTREDAMKWCFYWIEVYYNRARLHSTLGYKTPFEYERQAAA